MSYVLIRELLYTDDCTLTFHSEEYAKTASLDQKYRSTITTKARDYSDSTSSESRFEQIEGGGRVLLLRGHRIFSDCSIDADITSRIAKASATSGRLSRRLWNTRDVRLSTKLAVYKAAVILVLLYNCETWTAYGMNQATGQYSHEVPTSHCGDQLERLGNKHQGAEKVLNPWY